MPPQAKPYNFATLTPRNQPAVLGFSRLCEHIQQTPSGYTHQRRFMDIDAVQSSLGEALHDSPADSTDATELAPENDPLQRRVSTGKFVFSCSVRPDAPPVGWRCGYPRVWGKRDLVGRTDLALCLPEDASYLRIHGNHIVFNFQEDTGAFSIKAYNATWVDTNLIRKGCTLLLDKPQQDLILGEARYEFAYNVVDQAAFTEDRKNYMRAAMLSPSEPICAVSTPTDEDIHIGRWRLLDRIGQGSESVVVSAISAGNELAVVKTLDSKRSRRDIAGEIQRNRNITDKVSSFKDACYLLAFVESIAGEQTTYFVFSPHARYDMGSIVLKDPQTYDKQILSQLFLQALRGVGALHAAKFVHRDLKPANIGISSMDPPHAVVIDLGATIQTDELVTRPHSVGHGTVGYIAPEVEDHTMPMYGKKADVWSMGCVGFELLTPRRQGPSILWNRSYQFLSADGSHFVHHTFNPWRTFPAFSPPCPTEQQLEAQRKTHQQVQHDLKFSMSLLDNLLGDMLAKRPEKRLSIARVIDDLESIHIGDWPGRRTAETVPPLIKHQQDQESERESMLPARKSLKSVDSQAKAPRAR